MGTERLEFIVLLNSDLIKKYAPRRFLNAGKYHLSSVGHYTIIIPQPKKTMQFTIIYLLNKEIYKLKKQKNVVKPIDRGSSLVLVDIWLWTRSQLSKELFCEKFCSDLSKDKKKDNSHFIWTLETLLKNN